MKCSEYKCMMKEKINWAMFCSLFEFGKRYQLICLQQIPLSASQQEETDTFNWNVETLFVSEEESLLLKERNTMEK